MTQSRATDQTIGCAATLHLLPSPPSGFCRIGAQAVDQGLQLIGLSYRSAEVSVRSRVALSGAPLERFLDLLREHGAQEASVLSTCNRTEIYFVGLPKDRVVELWASVTGVDQADFQSFLYRKSGVCAGCHLFRVASGLDSAVLGESEIVAQVKSAWRDASFCGPMLNLVYQKALEASKRVRTETDLCRNVKSLGSLAVREVIREGGPIVEGRVLLLGAGQIAERVAKELQASGAKNVVVLNRTVERGKELAERYGLGWGSLEELNEELKTADVVFATATAPSPLITHGNLPADRKLVAVDLGIPPNIDAPGFSMLDVDALAAQCASSSEARSAAIPRALDILETELEKLQTAFHERQAAPTIRGLVQHGEAVRSQTVDWAMERLPNLTDRERQVVEDLARRLVLGMLTPPIHELKRGTFSSDERATLERAFGLNGEEPGR